MSYFILIVILVVILYLIYKLYHDFLSPSFAYTAFMLVGVVAAFIGLLYWNNITNLKFITMMIILVSVLSFCVCEFLARKFYKKFFNKKDLEKKEKQEYTIEWWKIILEILFVLVTTILLYNEIKRIAILGGYESGGFGVMVGKYRELSALFSTDIIKNGQGINIIVSQMRKICEVLCFINIFLLVRNFVDRKKNLRNFGYLFIILLSFFLSLLTAGRMQMLIYCVSAIFIFIVLKLKNNSFGDLIKKYLKWFVALGVVVISGFYLMLPLSGRKTDTNIVSYMSFYLGTSIPSLDIYLSRGIPETQFFGEETLRGIQTVLFKLKLSDYIQPVSKEWITFNDENGQLLQSNVFTSGKRYYHDFGWGGIVACQMIFSFVFTLMYLIALKSKKPIPIIFMSMYYFMILDQVRDDLFFSDFVHINTIFKFAMLFIIYNLLTIDVFGIAKKCICFVRDKVCKC